MQTPVEERVGWREVGVQAVGRIKLHLVTLFVLVRGRPPYARTLHDEIQTRDGDVIHLAPNHHHPSLSLHYHLSPLAPFRRSESRVNLTCTTVHVISHAMSKRINPIPLPEPVAAQHSPRNHRLIILLTQTHTTQLPSSFSSPTTTSN